ncbi:type VI secretion system tube protein TssD [Saccharicrinis aurantiacus]|uniref:type VI secretion system tube protein TssD n=1 Tax=Saccharicrinis aurantiacus TaxID=1849719 RepID=UPI0024909F18|nr:type VI secretion system tube protein TssD [Saccharicrinis aurantiacus]
MFGHKCFLRIGALDDSSINGLYRDSYELAKCEFGFGQGVDSNGKAQTEVTGGSISIVFPNIPKDNMLEWMLKSSNLQSGAIVVCNANDEPLEKIMFEDAACVNLSINYSQKGKGFTTTQMVIQARKIIVGETNIENNWKNL